MSANAEIIAELRRVLNERDEAREQLDLTKRELDRWVDRETKAVRERDSYQRQLDAIGDALVTSIVKRIEPRLSRHPVTVVMAAGSLIAKIGEAIGCEFEDGDDLLEAVKELVRECDEARRLLELAHLGRAQLEGWRDGLERERDEARAELAKLREDYDSVLEANVSLLDGAPYVNARDAIRERDEARAEVERLQAEAAPMNEHFNAGYRDGARDAFKRGAEAMREACQQWCRAWENNGEAIADALADLRMEEP